MKFPHFLQRFSFAWPLVISAGVVPFLVLPWFADAYEVHKAFVVIVCSVVSLVSFARNMMRVQTTPIRINVPLFSTALFLCAMLVSAFFSRAPALSWFGGSGGEYASVLFIFGCLSAAFIFAHVPSAYRVNIVRALSRWWSWGFLVCTLLLLVRYLLQLPISPALSFGTPHAFVLFLGVVIALNMGSVLDARLGKIRFCVLLILFAVCVVFALMLDAWVIWLPLLLFGCVGFFSAMLWRRTTQDEGRFSYVYSLLLILFALGGWIMPPLVPSIFPIEVAPSWSLSIDIIRQVWSEGLNSVWGFGPGTYGIAYGLHALASVNETIFWNVFFERGFSYVFTLAPTLGLFGTLVFISMQVSGMVFGFLGVVRAKSEERGAVFGIFLAFLFLSCAAWTYAWNVLLVFVWFVLFGVLTSFAPAKTLLITCDVRKPTIRMAVVWVMGVLCVSAVFFVSTARYASEIFYARALILERKSASREYVVSALHTALRIFPWNDLLYRETSILFLTQAQELVRERASAELVQDAVRAAVAAAVRATELGPNAAANWEVRGNVYREIAPVLSGADDFSIASFTTATELAPVNPRMHTGLGRAFLAKADVQMLLMQTGKDISQEEISARRQESLRLAEASFAYALTLKSDYAPAHHALALLLIEEGRYAEAVEHLVAVRAQYPEDLALGMQLVLLYMRQGKNDLAKEECERLISFAPTYANAHWYLSVILEEEGDLVHALAHVREVEKTNPSDEQVRLRRERLERGETLDDATTLLDSPIPEPLPENGVVSP